MGDAPAGVPGPAGQDQFRIGLGTTRRQGPWFRKPKLPDALGDAGTKASEDRGSTPRTSTTTNGPAGKAGPFRVGRELRLPGGFGVGEIRYRYRSADTRESCSPGSGERASGCRFKSCRLPGRSDLHGRSLHTWSPSSGKGSPIPTSPLSRECCLSWRRQRGLGVAVRLTFGSDGDR